MTRNPIAPIARSLRPQIVEDKRDLAAEEAARNEITASSDCLYCLGEGEIETDNNGPVVPCPICQPGSKL